MDLQDIANDVGSRCNAQCHDSRLGHGVARCMAIILDHWCLGPGIGGVGLVQLVRERKPLVVETNALLSGITFNLFEL